MLVIVPPVSPVLVATDVTVPVVVAIVDKTPAALAITVPPEPESDAIVVPPASVNTIVFATSSITMLAPSARVFPI